VAKVLAGKFKGFKLKSSNREQMRPTSARVKKSLFDSIQNSIIGSNILDLYAGIGTLGIEAISRGANKLVSVESDRKTFQILNHNIFNVCNIVNAETYCVKSEIFLKNNKICFNIIFADPPYGYIKLDKLKDMVFPLLDSSGLFVLETNETIVNSEDYIIKKYGETQIIIMKKNE
tara:strand:- start:54 stop:578 length:525 start_codon:yes stop_codon:yes gene_type:complete